MSNKSLDQLKDSDNLMNIKFLIHSKNKISPSDFATHSITLLRTLTSAFPTTVNVFNNHDKLFYDLSAVSLRSFEQNFAINHSQANLKLSRPFTSWIIFTVHTTETLSTIRKQQSVATILCNTKGRLSYHPWNCKTSDVVSLGFFVGPIPQYQTHSEFEKNVRSAIVTQSSINPSCIPDFRCILAKVSASTEESQLTCQAFELQVERTNVQKMLRLIYQTFSPDAGPFSFMFYRQRHQNPMVFIQAIQRQIQFQKEHRVIAVKGISEAQMFYFEECLRKEFPKILNVYTTKSTAKANAAGRPIGRYNLLCKTQDFIVLAQDLRNRLQDVFLKNAQHRGIELAHDAEPTEVISRLPTKTSMSTAHNNNRTSYYKAWSTAMSNYHVEPPNTPSIPPHQSKPPDSLTVPPHPTTVSWANIVATPVPKPPTSHNKSSIQDPPSKVPQSILKNPPLISPQVIADLQALRAEVTELKRLFEMAIARLTPTC